MFTTIKKIVIKTLLIGAFGGILGGIFLTQGNVYAQVDPSPTGQIKDAEKTNTTPKTDTSTFSKDIDEVFKVMMRLCYMILWPLIFLAGLAMDNSMVYGAFLHMDAPLWQFWNIAKNFANFALGFMILRSILKSIFTFGGAGKIDDGKTPLGVIKQALIAGILIQASWFLTSAIIDISTIATYSVGGMPITVMKSDATFGEKKFKRLDSSLDLRTTTQKMQAKEFQYWLSTHLTGADGSKIPILVSRCNITEIGDKRYIIGRELGDPVYSNTSADTNTNKIIEANFGRDKFPTRNFCILGNSVYAFNEFPGMLQTTGASIYTTRLKTIIKGIEVSTINKVINCGLAVPINEAIKTENCTAIKIPEKDPIVSIEPNNLIKNGKIDSSTLGSIAGEKWYQSTAAMKFGELIQGSKGLVGPLVTIYSSLLNFAALTEGDESLSELSGIAIIRLLMAVGLVFPLLALAVVLLIRIVFLRVVVAASPIIILASIFFKDSSLLKESKDSMFTFSIPNIIKNIFAPVIIVFALSLSLIFMTTLNEMLPPPTPISETSTDKEKQDYAKKVEENKQALKEVGIEVGTGSNDKVKTSILGLTTIETPKSRGIYAGNGLDWFSWMIVNFAGIGIMRFILFAAIKASGSIGGKVGDTIKGRGQDFLKQVPIVPIGGGMSFNAISSIPQKADEKFEAKKREQVRDMGEFMNDKMPGLKGIGESSYDTNGFSKYEKDNINKYIEEGNHEALGSYLGERNFDILNEKGEVDKDKLYNLLAAKDNGINLNSNPKFMQESGLGEIKEKQEAKGNFESDLGTPKDKKELDSKLSGSKVEALLKADPNYTKTVTVTEGGQQKTYTIKKDPTDSKKFISEDVK